MRRGIRPQSIGSQCERFALQQVLRSHEDAVRMEPSAMGRGCRRWGCAEHQLLGVFRSVVPGVLKPSV